MKKFIFALSLVLTLSSFVFAGSYNYISQDAMQSNLNGAHDMIIVDICPAPQFAKGHLPGSIETNAYPVKNNQDRAKLMPTLSMIKASSKPVVIVCPGGKGGAKRSYDYYIEQGVSENRLLILEKGMNGWPYQTEK